MITLAYHVNHQLFSGKKMFHRCKLKLLKTLKQLNDQNSGNPEFTGANSSN